MARLQDNEAKLDRDLSWMDWPYLRRLSVDGKTILFDEQGNAYGRYEAMIRRTEVDLLATAVTTAVPVETSKPAPATGVALYDGTWRRLAIGAEKQHDGRRWHRRSCDLRT